MDLRALLDAHMRSGGLATLTAVPLRSQYGHVVFDASGKVQRFEEKPLVRDYWINAGFFVFERLVFDQWHGHNLEQEVLPELSRRGLLYVNRHLGFWKSMDTSKDQQELEKMCIGGDVPWASQRAAARSASLGG
jgi:glucose-1-phosphate cytidylyltransferase